MYFFSLTDSREYALSYVVLMDKTRHFCLFVNHFDISLCIQSENHFKQPDGNIVWTFKNKTFSIFLMRALQITHLPGMFMFLDLP